jgi:hypothetical protein
VSILEELNALLSPILPIETGVFSGKAPDEYIVLTPLTDVFELHSDNAPQFETQEVRISLFCKANYLSSKRHIEKALLQTGFTITARQYLGREDDTGYFLYSIDASKIYSLE